MDMAARIDIEKQPISDLVEAMHRHAVARVIFAAGHSQLNRVERAISACEIEGFPAWLVADLFKPRSRSRTSMGSRAGRCSSSAPRRKFHRSRQSSWGWAAK